MKPSVERRTATSQPVAGSAPMNENSAEQGARRHRSGPRAALASEISPARSVTVLFRRTSMRSGLRCDRPGTGTCWSRGRTCERRSSPGRQSRRGTRPPVPPSCRHPRPRQVPPRRLAFEVGGRGSTRRFLEPLQASYREPAVVRARRHDDGVPATSAPSASPTIK